MNDNDLNFLKTLTDPRTPFLDIVRAMYRANRLLSEAAQSIVRAELENLQEAFRIGPALNPESVGLDVWPRADTPFPWGYGSCTAGARLWLPEPVGATCWLFVEFLDDAARLVAGLEFPRRSARTRWLESCRDLPEFAEVSWEGFALERAAPLGDITQVDEALANLLQEFLAEVRRVREPAGEV